VDLPLEHAAEEVTRLQRCINDLVSLLALPAMWTGSDESQIARTLLDVLLGMLRLDVAYVRLGDPDGGSPAELVRLAPSFDRTTEARQIGAALDRSLGDAPSKWSAGARVRVADIDLLVAPARLGLHGELGVLVAGSRRGDFPGQTERLLLSVAANHAAIALQEARRLGEQKRRAEDLDERVAQRTRELAAANEELKKEIVERRRVEAALRDSESKSRLIVDGVPAGIALLSAAGEVEMVNDQLLAYFGKTLEELKDWAADDVIHPEDRPGVIGAFTHLFATGETFDNEQRLRRHDGAYRWVRVTWAPLRDADGRIVGWCTLHTDVDERRRAEEALRASELNLRKIIDTIPALAWSARADGTAEFFNQHYIDYVGLSLEQLRDWGWTAAVHPDDLAGLAATWQAIVASGQEAEGEMRLRRRDGEYRLLLYRVNPLRDENGSIVKWYGINTDIEDRKRAEEELRRSEAFLAEGQRLSQTGTYSWRVDTDEITFSDQLRRIFELVPNAAATIDRIRERVHPEDRPMLAEKLERARAGSENPEYEIRLRMPDDRLKRLRVLGRLIRHPDGRLECLGAVQDVTERRIAEEALDKVRSELAHVTRVMSLGALTASIAHEVNQPLAGIITNAATCLRMLAADPPNVEGARETARRTIRDGNRAADVITRLRALFGRKAVVSETVDLNEATRGVLALLFGDLLRNRVVLRVELDDDPLLVSGDRVQLQEVILNLVRNALDAMRDVNDRPRDLLVRADTADEGGARLVVKDTGVGFAPQDAERLFDAFYTTKADGMGIGLSLSRSIIESHGGTLRAEPNDGPGVTFSFCIPRVEARAIDQRTGGARRSPGLRASTT
jgi:PAS domain S-box-containing protein